MPKLLIVLMTSAGLIAATPALSADMSKEAYKDAMQRIDATFKSDKEQCKSFKANAKDICMAQANGRQKIDKADAEAQYKGTGEARTAARIARADADYSVAKEKCDDLAGNAKDVCVKEAQAVHVSATADARADRKVNDARRDASEDKRDAEYKVALERCDTFNGDAKSRCVKDAKARFGKS
jgi:hypothetical protein